MILAKERFYSRDQRSCWFTDTEENVGVFLGVAKALLSSYCVVVWVLLIVFCFFSFTSLGISNTKKLPNRVQFSEDWYGTPIWPLFFVLEHQYGRHDVI